MPAQAGGFRRDETALFVLPSAAAGAGVIAADRRAHRSCLIEDLLLDESRAELDESPYGAIDFLNVIVTRL